MRKLSYALLVTLMTLSLPSDAAEKPEVMATNILCDLLGIGCSSADTGGTGKEPPKVG